MSRSTELALREAERARAVGWGDPTAMSHTAYMANNPHNSRQERANRGWWNWYYNRGRIPLDATTGDLRRISWRRAL